MKVQRIYTDNRGSFIEVAEIVKIEEIEKKFEAEGVEYDTHEEAQAVLDVKSAKEVKPAPLEETLMEAIVEDKAPQIGFSEKAISRFKLTPVD